MTRITGKQLAQKHGIKVAQALYRELGNWFHLLNVFPAALFDSNGYLIFESRGEYDEFVNSGEVDGVKEYKKTNTLTIKGGISRLPGYSRFDERNFPEEIAKAETFWEGSIQRVLVNRYERDPKARLVCIDHWGCNCSVCGFDFSNVYGEIGIGFIHVHHLKMLSSIGAEYHLDAKTDLRPVCPNCHAMLHKKDPPFTIEALQKMLKFP